MLTSLFWAKFFAFYFLLVPVALFVRTDYYLDLMRKMGQHPMSLLISAIISLFLGAAILSSHCLFVWDWRLLITLLGVISTLKGFQRLIWPEFCIDGAKYFSPIRLKIMSACLFLVGLYLSYIGWCQ